MIVEFSVKNFRSIRELQTISFVATSLGSNQDKYPEVDRNNIAEEGGMRLLKTVGIYGPNASGKSNVIKALSYFMVAVSDLPSSESRLGSLADPFLYQEQPRASDSFFQIVLILGGKKYRYGFTVRKNSQIDSPNASKEIVTSEWLFGPKEKNQVKYFTRKDLEIQKENLPNGKMVPQLQYPHTLYLTHAAAFVKGICSEISNFFRRFTISTCTSSTENFLSPTLWMIDHPEKRRDLLSFLAGFGLHYDDIEMEREEGQSLEEAFKKNGLSLVKKAKVDGQAAVKLDLMTHESDGTRKLLNMAGLLSMSGTISPGFFIVLDELDSNFHPSLVRRFLQLCNDKAFNQTNFQLLFTSHDTNLMDPEIMRRDQFYFAEKDTQEATYLFSLSDLKGVRNDADFSRHYLAGFYGALPLLRTLTTAIAE
jgi:uncharacterized protein